jgi:hypothetical protein
MKVNEEELELGVLAAFHVFIAKVKGQWTQHANHLSIKC